MQKTESSSQGYTGMFSRKPDARSVQDANRKCSQMKNCGEEKEAGMGRGRSPAAVDQAAEPDSQSDLFHIGPKWPSCHPLPPAVLDVVNVGTV
jgi:hypothetical protein